MSKLRKAIDVQLREDVHVREQADKTKLSADTRQKTAASAALARALARRNLSELRQFIGVPRIPDDVSSGMVVEFLVHHPNLPDDLMITVVDSNHSSRSDAARNEEGEEFYIFSREPNEAQGFMWRNHTSTLAEYLNEVWIDDEDETVVDPGDDDTTEVKY